MEKLKNIINKNKNNNRKGFTLAEMMVSMLIVSILLAAIMPTVVKNLRADRDHIWKWVNNDSIYYNRNAVGHQGAFTQIDGSAQVANANAIGSMIVGLSVVPTYRDAGIVDVPGAASHRPDLNGRFVVYTNNPSAHPLQKSYIDLYEHLDAPGATQSDFNYSGRIAADDENIAFGIGTLHKAAIVQDSSGKISMPEYNTAVGQFALNNGTIAYGNTAIGYGALRNNLIGQGDTAIGSGTGLITEHGNDNTLIGTMAGAGTTTGVKDGNRNTIIGSNACGNLVDDNANSKYASRNICIGYKASGNETFTGANSTDRLFIGSDSADSGNYVPLISGHTNFDLLADVKYDKDINFNLKEFNVSNSDYDLDNFKYIVKRGSGGYDTSSSDYFGETLFTYDPNPSAAAGGAHPKEIITTSDPADKNIIKIEATKGYDSQREIVIGINTDLLLRTATDSSSPAVNFNSCGNEEIVAGTSGIELNGLGMDLKNNSSTPSEFNLSFDQNTKFSGKEKNLKMSAKSLWYRASDNIEFVTNDVNKPVQMQPVVAVMAPGLPPGSSKNIIMNADSKNVNFNNGTVSLDGAGYITASDIKITWSHATRYSGRTVLQALTDLRTRYNSIHSIDVMLSDAGVKDVSGENTAGLDEINRIQVKNYTLKKDKTKTPHVGVIAQDLRKIFPNSVIKDDDGYLKIRTEEMFYAAINSVKQLYAKLIALCKQIDLLDKKTASVEKQTQQIKKENDEILNRLKRLKEKTEKISSRTTGVRSEKHE